MNFVFSKQSEKALSKMDVKQKEKIYKALQTPSCYKKLARVKEHKGDRYGVKIEHYRAIVTKHDSYYSVDTVDSKTNMKQKKYGYF